MASSLRRTQHIIQHILPVERNEVPLSSTPTNGAPRTDKDDFVEIFPILAQELIRELPTTFEMPPHAVKWMQKLNEVNVQGGKMNRGLTVIHSLQLLSEGRKLARNEVFNALVLGWCVEWLQAFFLVADDIMDQSVTRRGVPCWYRQKNPVGSGLVGNIAINDSFLLEACIYRILSKYFHDMPYYADLVDLFHEVSYQTELGQLLDLTQPPRGDFSAFTLDNYQKIVKYKTAYYSFYLPVALAMMMAGITSKPAYDAAKEILLPMGEYFQVQDDFLDCYGSAEVIGKVGRDIEENKCSWLVVQALNSKDRNLKEFSPAQIEHLLQENYGYEDPKKVAKVKDMYIKIGIPKIFEEYERKCKEDLEGKIHRVRIMPQEVFVKLLDKIFKRSK